MAKKNKSCLLADYVAAIENRKGKHMTGLLELREYLKQSYAKYEVYLKPCVKFLTALVSLIACRILSSEKFIIFSSSLIKKDTVHIAARFDKARDDRIVKVVFRILIYDISRFLFFIGKGQASSAGDDSC